jgi:predicted nuclease of restriction endonuclease-like (RecB) superfamily
MVQFAELFPEQEIVATLSRQLSWSHFSALLPLSQPFQREFYAEMARIEGWSVRTLRARIDSMLYERTALSKQPDAMIRQELAILRSKGDLTPALLLKDPYVLDFLGLTDRFVERDLEDAILRELETFLLELGEGFSFVARQKRIQLDGDDFYIDLLFYNRKLRRLVVVELKQGSFKPEYKGQMELYLRCWRSVIMLIARANLRAMATLAIFRPAGHPVLFPAPAPATCKRPSLAPCPGWSGAPGQPRP